MGKKVTAPLLALFFFVLACNIIGYLSEPALHYIPTIFFFIFGCIIGTFDYKEYHNKKLSLLIGLVLLILMWILVYPQIHQGYYLLTSLMLSTVCFIIFLYIFPKVWERSQEEKEANKITS